MYSIIHLRSALPPPSSMPSSMDSSTAGGSAATGRTVGGRSVNFSGCRGRPPKKPLFGRDDRLARDGARLMTGHFRPPALLLLPAAPTAASTSILAAVGRPASPPPVAAVAASATVDLTFGGNAGDHSDHLIRATAMAVTSPIDSVWSRTTTRCYLLSPAWHIIPDLALQ